MRCLESIIDSIVMNLSKLWETVKDWEPGILKSMGLQRVRVAHTTERLNNNRTLHVCPCVHVIFSLIKTQVPLD